VAIQATNPAIIDPKHTVVIDIATLCFLVPLLERGPCRTTFTTIGRLCFAKMSPVTHLVLFVSPRRPPPRPLLISDAAISQLDTDDTQWVVGDILAILKACSVCHAQQPRDWFMAMLRKAFAFVLAGLLFVLAFFEVGVFCWPYKDLNEMLQQKKQCGSPDTTHR